jgi:pantetheine-phosphate adenylyltransferase
MIAVYAGTFDPVTVGHASIVSQAARLFAHVRVLIAENPNKKPLFNVEERAELLRTVFGKIPNVSVDWTSGLVVTYAREIGASLLVRGIRGASDATWETDLAQQNRLLAPDVQTVLIPAEPHLSGVSSSELKAKARAGESLETLCHPAVASALMARYRSIGVSL